MKRTAFTVFTILLVAAFFQASCKSMSTEKLKNSIEVLDVETKWVSKYYQPWPPRLILVPSISFRIKNIGDQPLKYVNFNGVFSFKGETENLGDGYLAAIRGTPIPPGITSDIITLTSNFGVEGKNLKQIEENPSWKTVEVRIFAQSRGSQYALLGVFDISRIIDFKEPESVEPQKTEPIKK